MKIGIVGSGAIVPEFLDAAARVPQAEITAIAARNERQRAQIAAQYGIPVQLAHYEDLLRRADVEAVYIALPNSLHVQYTRRALESGRHVLLEKPAAATRAGLEELYALAKTNGVLLFEMITNRYHPMFSQVQKWLPAIGRVRVVQMNYSQYSRRYDRFLKNDIAPAFDPSLGGGALQDLNVYNIQLAAGWFGRPKDVLYLPNMVRGVDPSGVLLLSYPDFQCICTAAKDCAAPSGFQVQGELGCIVCTCPPNKPDTVTLELRSGEKETFAADESLLRLEPELAAICPAADSGAGEKLAAAMAPVSLLTAEILERAIASAGISAGNAAETCF